MPRSQGGMTAFVDADHAGDLLTRRSYSGILIYLNNTPIVWYCKKQNTVEASTLGNEFSAMRMAVDLIQTLRYKLRMLGTQLHGPTEVYCDNESVFKNSSIDSSTLNKKHVSICYHRVREAVASGMIIIAWIPSTENVADLFTKILPMSHRTKLISNVLYMNSHSPNLSTPEAC